QGIKEKTLVMPAETGYFARQTI
ncbi:uncharacterized protein METZ01_LOCUS381002, partial [marine metagenome]